MAFGDITRINTNIGAMNALNALNYVNRELAIHQLRLATGKRLNSAMEGPAEYSIAKELEGIARRWDVAVSNIKDAFNLMSTAETGVTKIKDILLKMAELAEQAANDTLSTEDRNRIKEELEALGNEINQTVKATLWRGTVTLLNGNFKNKRIWVGPMGNATANSLTVSLSQALDLTSLGITWANLAVNNSTVATKLLKQITDSALSKTGTALNTIGTYEERLSVKEIAATEHETDIWASYSRIMDADMALEQLQVTKFTILQQAAVAGLAQANVAPSFVLGLLGG